MSNKQKECYWDKSIDMSKATLQVDGKVVCKFDNDNQTIIVNEGFKTLRELELEARVKDLEERIINHSNTVEEYCSRLANKEKECEELKKQLMQKDEVNTFFNTPIEGWSSNPCDICENKNNYEQLTQECDTLKSQLDFEVQQKECIEQECEELKKKLNTSEEWRIKAENLNEKQDLENTRYRKALEEIEEIVKRRNYLDYSELLEDILGIINEAKEEE